MEQDFQFHPHQAFPRPGAAQASPTGNSEEPEKHLNPMFKLFKRIRSRMLAFDCAWDLVLNNSYALAEEEQIAVRKVRNLSHEDIKYIREEIRTVEYKIKQSKKQNEQIAILRREIMKEAETFKINLMFLTFSDDIRNKMRSIGSGDGLEDLSLAQFYFVSRFKFTVLRYAAHFRYDDLGEKDWYHLFAATVDKRNKVFARAGEYFLKNGRPAAEALIVQQYDESLIPHLKDELAYWPPRMEVPPDRILFLENFVNS